MSTPASLAMRDSDKAKLGDDPNMKSTLSSRMSLPTRALWFSSSHPSSYLQNVVHDVAESRGVNRAPHHPKHASYPMFPLGKAQRIRVCKGAKICRKGSKYSLYNKYSLDEINCKLLPHKLPFASETW